MNVKTEERSDEEKADLSLKPNSPGGHSAVEPPVPIPNTEVKCSHADGSATYVCVRVGHCQASHSKSRRSLRFFNLSADMAQLVERTLGKGEVPSSILGISTTPKHLMVLFLFFRTDFSEHFYAVLVFYKKTQHKLHL